MTTSWTTTNMIHAMVMTKASQFIAQITAWITAMKSNAPSAVFNGRMMTGRIGVESHMRGLWLRWRG
jgi:hypothetical protein